MSKNNTKRSLLASVFALVLCVAMLVGSTFAWFTDTATTGVNKITSGKLDVKLSYLDGNEWKEVTKETRLFDESALWEPGHTEVAYLKVENAGNLALKYQLSVNVANEKSGVNVNGDKFNLSDYIKMGVVESDKETTYATRALARAAVTDAGNIATYTKNGNIAANGDAQYVALVVYMPETVGNEANYVDDNVPSIELGVTLLATQYTVESDSFGNDYDENAQYPDVAYVTVKAPTADDIDAGVNPLANALTAAAAENDAATGEVKQKITAALGAGEFTLKENEGKANAAVRGKDVTLAGAGKLETTYKADKGATAGASDGGAAGDYSFDGAKSVVFKDMTIEFKADTNYQGFVRAGAVRFENCIIKGMGANWGVGDVVFDNCEFVNDAYNLWTYAGSSFTFNNCTFTSDSGKFINVYRQGNPDAIVDVTLNNCKFINKGATASKAAVNIKSQCAWNVTINNCTTEGEFPTANGGLWQSAPDYGTANAGNTVTVNP